MMSKRRKTILVGIAVFAAALVAALAGVLFYAHTNHAGLQIQKRASERIPGRIVFKDYDLSLTQGRIELGNVLVRDDRDRPAVGMERLVVRVSLSELLRKNIQIEEILIENPQVQLVAYPDGGLNIVRAFVPESAAEEPPAEKKPEDGESSFNFVLKSFLVENGEVSFDDPSRKTSASLKGIGLNISGNLKEKIWRLDFSTKEGEYSGGDVLAAVDSLRLSGALDKDKVEGLDLEIKTDSSILKIAGSAKELFSEPVLDLATNIVLNLAELCETLSLEQDLTGTVAGDISAKGPAGNPEVALELVHSGGNLAGYPAEKIDLKAFLSNKKVRVESLLVAFASGSLKIDGESDLGGVFPGGFLSSPKSFEALSYDLSVVADKVRLKSALGDSFAGKGQIDGIVKLQGRGISLEEAVASLQMDIAGDDISAGEFEPIDISVESTAFIDRGEALVEKMEIDAGTASVSVEGRYGLAGKEIEANIAADAPDLAKTLSPLGIKNASGSVKLRATVSGTLQKPLFDLFLEGKKVGFEQVHIGDVGIDAVLDNSGVLKLSKLALSNQGSAIKGEGTVKLFENGDGTVSFLENIGKVHAALPIDFELSIGNLEATDFVASIPVAGSIDGKLRATGDLKDLKADLEFAAKNFAFEENHVGNVAVSAKLRDGQVSIGKATVKNNRSAIEVSGTVGVFEKNGLTPKKDPSIDLALKAESLYVQDFTDMAKAKISISADIEGTVNNPGGKFEVRAAELDLGAQKLDGVYLKGDLRNRKIGFDPVKVVFPGGQSIQGNGWVSLDKEYSVELFSEGVSLGSIDAIREKGGVEGLLVLNVSGKGSFEKPGLQGKVAVENLLVNEKELGDFAFDLNVADSVAKVSGKLNFDVDATYHLKKQDFSATLVFGDTDLSPYFNLAGLQDFSGRIRGRAGASGNVSQIEKIDGFGEFQLLDVFMKGEELAHAENFSVKVKNRTASVSGLNVRLLREGILRIEGDAAFDGALSVNADGSIPLKGLQLATDVLPDITGTVEIQADLQGSTQKPDVRGEIRLNNIGFTIPELLQNIHGVNGRITISPEALRIEKIQGQLDSGRFEIDGDMKLDGFSPGEMKVDLAARGLPIKVPDTLDILLQSDLTFSGVLNDSSLAGEVIVLEGLYYKDIETSILGSAVQKKRAVSPETHEEPDPMLQNLKLDIAVKRRNPFIVDNNLAYLDINPDMRVAGTAADPAIRGRTTIESGMIRYQRKEFEVKKGVIDFVNPYELEPTLDIVSTVDIRKWLVTLTVFGTPDNLVFQLSSDPPEEDGDILSLLVLGKTTKELIGAEGGSKQSAEQMLTEVIASTFGDDIKRITGLDYFELDADSLDESDTDPEGVMVTVGKNLSERLTVKYSVDSRTGEMIQRAISEYKLLENVIMSAFQDSEGHFGGEIQYKLEFR